MSVSVNAAWNGVVLTARRNDCSEVAALTDEGWAFQARAATTGKAQSPSVERCVDGTISVDVAADRRRRRTWTSADVGVRAVIFDKIIRHDEEESEVDFSSPEVDRKSIIVVNRGSGALCPRSRPQGRAVVSWRGLRCGLSPCYLTWTLAPVISGSQGLIDPFAIAVISKIFKMQMKFNTTFRLHPIPHTLLPRRRRPLCYSVQYETSVLNNVQTWPVCLVSFVFRQQKKSGHVHWWIQGIHSTGWAKLSDTTLHFCL